MTRYTDHKSGRVLAVSACFTTLPGVPIEYDLVAEYVTGFDAPEQIYVVRDLDELTCTLARTQGLFTKIYTESEDEYYD